jgi:hypothetical protein
MPQATFFLLSDKASNIISFTFFEISLYFSAEQMIFIQIIEWIYNENTAWMLSLYCAFYYIQHVAYFSRQFPSCTVSTSNVLCSMIAFVMCTLLTSFILYSPFSFSLNTKYIEYNEFFRFHFEAWTLADLLSYLHFTFWQDKYKHPFQHERHVNIAYSRY